MRRVLLALMLALSGVGAGAAGSEAHDCLQAWGLPCDPPPGLCDWSGWSSCNPAPRALRSPDSYPCEIGEVKGNLNSGIFHMPWNQYYGATRSATLCFMGEWEAHNYGFRPARI